MQEFCAAVGELILWANHIDLQLNKAILLMFVLPDHPFIEPIISHLDARAKCEILKKRAKLISDQGATWKAEIKTWVDSAEKANGHRNIVAHHHIKIDGGKVKLATNQLSKIFSTLDSSFKQKPSNGLAEVKEWIAHAKKVVGLGDTVLQNLQSLADKVNAESKNLTPQ